MWNTNYTFLTTDTGECDDVNHSVRWLFLCIDILLFVWLISYQLSRSMEHQFCVGRRSCSLFWSVVREQLYQFWSTKYFKASVGFSHVHRSLYSFLSDKLTGWGAHGTRRHLPPLRWCDVNVCCRRNRSHPLLYEPSSSHCKYLSNRSYYRYYCRVPSLSVTKLPAFATATILLHIVSSIYITMSQAPPATASGVNPNDTNNHTTDELLYAAFRQKTIDMKHWVPLPDSMPSVRPFLVTIFILNILTICLYIHTNIA